MNIICGDCDTVITADPLGHRCQGKRNGALDIEVERIRMTPKDAPIPPLNASCCCHLPFIAGEDAESTRGRHGGHFPQWAPYMEGDRPSRCELCPSHGGGSTPSRATFTPVPIEVPESTEPAALRAALRATAEVNAIYYDKIARLENRLAEYDRAVREWHEMWSRRHEFGPGVNERLAKTEHRLAELAK